MKKINKVLLITGLIITICIIVIIIVLLRLQENDPSESQAAVLHDNDAVIETEVVSELDGISEYFNLKNCIQLYYSAITNLRYSTSENEIGLATTQSRG